MLETCLLIYDNSINIHIPNITLSHAVILPVKEVILWTDPQIP